MMVEKQKDNNESIKCEECDKTYGNKNKLHAHRQAVHVIGSYVCEFCSKDFKNKYYLRNHVRLIHESVVEGTVFMCDCCTKLFKNNNQLWHHKKAVHGTRIYECNMCNALLKSARTLKKHYIKCPKKSEAMDNIKHEEPVVNMDLKTGRKDALVQRETDPSAENRINSLQQNGNGNEYHGGGDDIKLGENFYEGDKIEIGDNVEVGDETEVGDKLEAGEKFKASEGANIDVGETEEREIKNGQEMRTLKHSKVKDISDFDAILGIEVENEAEYQGFLVKQENEMEMDPNDENSGIFEMESKFEKGIILQENTTIYNPQVGHSRKEKVKKCKSNADEKVICEICSKEYSRKRIKEHVKAVHANDGGKCPNCEKYFPTSKYLNNHFTQIHLKEHIKEPVYLCQFCSKEFEASKLKAHIRNYHSGKNLNCELCGKSYENLKHFKAHKEMAHSVIELACHLCLKKFSNKHYLRQHVRLVHESEGNSVSCEQCGKLFGNSSRLNHHTRAVHSIQNSTCNVCSKMYKNKYLLRKHVKKYH